MARLSPRAAAAGRSGEGRERPQHALTRRYASRALVAALVAALVLARAAAVSSDAPHTASRPERDAPVGRRGRAAPRAAPAAFVTPPSGPPCATPAAVCSTVRGACRCRFPASAPLSRAARLCPARAAGPRARPQLRPTALTLRGKGGLRPPPPPAGDVPAADAPSSIPATAPSFGGGGVVGGNSGGGGGGGGGGYGPQDINLGLFLGQDDRPERRAKKVFVTGATGSIGRCVVAQLLQDTQHTVYCLVRNPALLRLPRAVREQARTRLVLLIGDISDPGVYGRAAAEADCAVLLACSWGGPDCYKVNVEGTLKVINCLKSSAQVLYASSAALITADGLGGQEVQAGDKSLPWGASDYLKSKASALAALTSIGPLQPRLTVVYPSLVLGPRSRSAARRSVEEGLLPRLLVATGLASSTHFIHPTDAAQVPALSFCSSLCVSLSVLHVRANNGKGPLLACAKRP